MAGCGTSQAAEGALSEPKARDTAIDKSETSLQHTRRLKKSTIWITSKSTRFLPGIGTTPAELEELGATLSSLPQDHPLAPLPGQAKEFQHPAEIADAQLHPLDHAYTVPDLYELLPRCGLFFGRWFEQAPYLPYCGRLAGTPHYARLAALPAHANMPQRSYSEAI